MVVRSRVSNGFREFLGTVTSGSGPAVREGSSSAQLGALPIEHPTRAARAGTPLCRATAPPCYSTFSVDNLVKIAHSDVTSFRVVTLPANCTRGWRYHASQFGSH